MDLRRFIQIGLKINVALAIISVSLCIGFFLKGLSTQGDLTNFYTGWMMVKEGYGDQLYDLELQAKIQRQILGFSFEDGVLPYSNPPHAVFPFLPLAWLPFKLAVIAWIIINLGVLAAILRHVLSTIAATWSQTERQAIILITLAFTPLQITFMLGTFSLMVAACLMAAMIAFQRGQDVRGATWLFVASIKFPLIILPAIALLGGRRWKAIATGVGLSAVAGVLTGFIFGWSIWDEYLSFLSFHNDSYGRFGINPLLMDNFKGLLTHILGMEHIQAIATISAIGLIIGIIIAIGLMFRNWNPNQADWAIRCGLIIALGVFFNLHLYTHDLMLLLIAGLLGYAGLRESGRTLDIQRFAGFLFAFPGLIFISDWLLFSILPIGNILLVLGLIGWLGWLLVQRKAVPALSIPE